MKKPFQVRHSVHRGGLCTLQDTSPGDTSRPVKLIELMETTTIISRFMHIEFKLSDGIFRQLTEIKE